MKKQLNIFVLLLVPLIAFGQETTLKEYSFTQLFEMIKSETDSVFELENAAITLNPKTDQRFKLKSDISDTIVINKGIRLSRVLFGRGSNIKNIHFKKHLFLENCIHLAFNNCVFDGVVTITNQEELLDKSLHNENSIFLFSNVINRGLRIFFRPQTNLLDKGNIQYTLLNNKIHARELQTLNGYKKSSFDITLMGALILNLYNNDIRTGSNGWNISGYNMEGIFIKNNTFNSDFPGTLSFDKIEEVQCTNNTFNQTIWMKLSGVNDPYIFSWGDFSGRLLNDDNFFSGLTTPQQEAYLVNSDSIVKVYKNFVRIENPLIYQGELALLSKFLNHFRNIHNSESANTVYKEIKNLETQRLAFLYKTNPRFKNYFSWKINQFLKVFSAYGTEPARAVIFSLYVIICFAFIYLFFPNSWDKHGKNRIIDRYSFFFTYMNKKAGIHEVYLDEQKEELMSYDQFKNNITNSEQKVPKFFTATALPLYKWAISGTKLSAAFLKRIDIMKGTWSDLPARKRFWKSILLVGAFLIAVLYDIFIKMLNALMLSINTFTTLGFGEIPIKGLPRYLAIIQGFIGWFMLTIFSVSLISQLLN